MTVCTSRQAPPALKQSRAKIWIRTGILTVFGVLFGVSLYKEIHVGHLSIWLALGIFLACLPVGFWLRRLVPMQVYPLTGHITLSFDRIYFALIWLLVIGKALTGYLLGLNFPADVIMCMILGLMFGRLSGICLRVRGLKLEHGFAA